MAWLLLIIAGLMEVAWAALLPATSGLTRPIPTAGFLAALGISMFLLARATETIPLGTAYPVWVGIGAVGAATVGIVVYDDPASLVRILLIGLLVISIVGLKLTSSS